MAFGRNFTTMKFDDLLGDGKTKACTTVSGGSGRVQTEELLEDPFQFFRRNGRAFVFHDQGQDSHIHIEADLYD